MQASSAEPQPSPSLVRCKVHSDHAVRLQSSSYKAETQRLLISSPTAPARSQATTAVVSLLTTVETSYRWTTQDLPVPSLAYGVQTNVPFPLL